MIRRNKKLGLLALGLAALVAVPAYALIGPKNVDGQLRVASYVIPRVVIPTTGVTVATGGVILASTIWDGAAAANVSVNALTIAALPYPSKLRVGLLDGGAGSGDLTCTSVAIRGKNQFGQDVSETVSTITETAQLTARVYETVDSIVSAGCAIASGGDTSDVLQVTGSAVVGLPRKLRVAADIISMSVYDVSATATITMRGSGTMAGAAVSLNEAGAIDIDDSAVDIADAQNLPVVANDDLGLTFRIRAFDPPNTP